MAAFAGGLASASGQKRERIALGLVETRKPWAPHFSPLRSRLAAAVLGGLAAAAVGSIAWASIPDSDGVITACVKSAGQVTIIDEEAGEACKGTEQRLRWESEATPSNPQTVFALSALNSEIHRFAEVLCPAETFVTGGGASISGEISGPSAWAKLALLRSAPMKGGISNPAAGRMGRVGG